MRDREIIHINVADFAVAVERSIEPTLRSRPVLIAAEGAARAAVYDMSEEAYRTGVRKGMALRRAQRLCRDARVLPPHPDRYERAMQELLRRALPYSPLIEAVDEKGHLFIDATGTDRLFGPSPDVAWRIRNAVRADLQLDPIWSVAPSKLVAKVATRLVKPDGESIVLPGEEEEFLQQVPLRLMPGIERDDLERLNELHLARAGELARWSLPQLGVAFGNHARSLYETVRGIDPSPVLPVGQKRPVVGAEHEFGEDTNEVAVVEGVLYRLVEEVGAELRQRRLAAPRIGLTIDYSDGMRITRQATTPSPTANDLRLFALARVALQRAWARRVRVRHLKVVCDRLRYPPAQLELFPEDEVQPQREDRLIDALDAIRQKFGQTSIRVGRRLAAGS